MSKTLYYLAKAYKLKTVIISGDDKMLNRYQFTKNWGNRFYAAVNLEGQENGLENGHNGTEVSVSDLAHIDYTGNNPFELFKEWHGEARASQLVNPDALCFTSCSKDGTPSSRHLLMRRLDDDGIVIMTDNRSRKSKELAENPRGCIAFLWSYRKDGVSINRQVRIEGRIEDLCQSSCQAIWDREPVFCKIRAHICDQGTPTVWEELKQSHDTVYEDFVRSKQLPPMPSHVVFYKLIPHFMDFYYAYNNCIGDRLAFHGLDKEAKSWKVERIAA